MKEHTIFVEGEADKCFIEQLIETLPDICNQYSIKVTVTKGWTNLVCPEKTMIYVNQMNITSANDGVNLVIFDADENFKEREQEILKWKEDNNLDFELFLLPNNSSTGELEDLLESIINPENKAVMDCWENYEKSLKGITISWRKGEPLTTPAKKTKIYAYLEALLGKSKSQKELIKESKRNYLDERHWVLNAKALKPLVDFLKNNLTD